VRNLGLNLHAAGPLKAIAFNEFVHALNGNIDININNVQYAGVDISHLLASLLGSLPAGQKDQLRGSFPEPRRNAARSKPKPAASAEEGAGAVLEGPECGFLCAYGE
jgi:hypothetical protein